MWSEMFQFRDAPNHLQEMQRSEETPRAVLGLVLPAQGVAAPASSSRLMTAASTGRVNEFASLAPDRVLLVTRRRVRRSFFALP